MFPVRESNVKHGDTCEHMSVWRRNKTRSWDLSWRNGQWTLNEQITYHGEYHVLCKLQIYAKAK